ALDEGGFDFGAPAQFPMFLEDGLSERGGFAVDAADFDAEENQAVEEGGTSGVDGLPFVEGVILDFLARGDVLEIEPGELFVKIADDGEAAHAVGDAAEARADIYFVDGFEQISGVGFWIPLAAAGDEGILNIIEHGELMAP